MELIPRALAASEADTSLSGLSFPDTLLKVLIGIAILVGVYLTATLIAGWVKNAIQKRQGDKNKEVIVLYGRIVFFAVFTLGTMLGLAAIGVPLGWFSGGVGLGIAFAMRSFITNFFAGIMLLTNDRFNIGDFVSLSGGVSGKILEIRGRNTTLLAADGAEITIPNTKLLNSNVVCYARNPNRRHDLIVSVGYETDLKVAAKILKKTALANKNVESNPKPMVLIGEAADSAINLKVRFWTKTHSQWWIVKSNLMRDMMQAIEAAGIDIPYPIQTLRVDEVSSGLLAQGPAFFGKGKQKTGHSRSQPEAAHEAIFQPTPVEVAKIPSQENSQNTLTTV